MGESNNRYSPEPWQQDYLYHEFNISPHQNVNLGGINFPYILGGEAEDCTTQEYVGNCFTVILGSFPIPI